MNNLKITRISRAISQYISVIHLTLNIILISYNFIYIIVTIRKSILNLFGEALLFTDGKNS